VDIQTELTAVQHRIAQITGTLTPAAPVPLTGGFASMVAGFTPETALAQRAMQWPVAGSVTSQFGERKDPLGRGRDFHPGLDIAADEGSPITAAAAGRVIAAGPEGGYGNLIVVDNGNGVTTRYGHCSQIYARVGDTVSAGQPIGAVGSTGRSTGPHLHFEVRMNDTPVDPTAYLPR
jgi:murein DD-endopeptidase MepM/ murein hydrolase activator NlpD